MQNSNIADSSGSKTAPSQPSRRKAIMTGVIALAALPVSTPTLTKGGGAGAAPNLFVEVSGRKPAYRSAGEHL